jgi:RNA polymerase primary sigma factor
MRQLKITKQITNRESDSINKYFNEISKLPLLSENEESNLATKAAAGDSQALEALVKGNLRFVISVAKQYQNRGLDLPDLINEGNIGLIRAAKKFDNNRGFKFISYAVWWIRQSILHALAEHSRTVRIPPNQTASLAKFNKAISNLEQNLEREPTDEEIQAVLEEFDISKIKDMRTFSNKTLSLEAPVSDEEGSMTLLDYIPNKDSVTPDSELNKESFKDDLLKVLNRLNERQQTVIILYYGLKGQQPLTLEDIGIKLNLTRERVRQIKDTALRVLKGRINSSVLMQHM